MALSDYQFTQLKPNLFTWSAYDNKLKVRLCSHAYTYEGKVILVDPIDLTDEIESTIRSMGTPNGIFLTNCNHERDSQKIKNLFTIPVSAPAYAFNDFTYKPEAVLYEGKVVQGIEPISIPGAAQGEHAFYYAAEKTMFVGDCLVNLEERGFELLPENYCCDAAMNKESLKKLLLYQIDLMLFAHGEPLYSPLKSLKKLL